MAWARVQSVGNSGSLGNGVVTYSQTLGSAPTTGNLLVAITSISASVSVPTIANIKDGNGNSFTLVKDIAFTTNSTDGHMAVYTLVVPGTPSTTVTANFTNNTGGAGVALMAIEFSGSSATIDGTAVGNNQATGTVTQPAYSSTASLELLLSCYGDDGDPTLSAGSWTADTNNVTSSTHGQVGIQYKNSTNGSETGGGWTSASGGDAGIVVFALKLPGGATTPVPPILISPTRRRLISRGVSKLIKGVTPAAPGSTPLPPIFISQAHRRRPGGFIEVLIGAQVAVPVPPILVTKPPPRRRGRSLFLRGSTPVVPVAVPPIHIITPTHTRRRGVSKLLRGTTPAAVTAPVPPILIVTPTHVRRRGVSKLFRGTVPAPVTAPVPPILVVTPTHIRRRGITKLIRGNVPAPITAPVPPIYVITPTHIRRRGRSNLFRGNTPAPVIVPIPPTIVSRILHRLNRGRILIFRGNVTITPPPTTGTFACIHVYDQLSTTVTLSDKLSTTISLSEKVC